jgi:hypothetical protein
MTEFRTPPAHEPGPQPDPMLQTGRRSSGWMWLFGIAILVIVVGTLYGINNQEPQTASNEPAAQTTGSGSNAAPQSSPAAGRGTADAPEEQQAQGQTGKGSGAEQNPAAGAQGKSGATTGQGNSGQQQGNQGGQNNPQPPKQQ